MQLNDALTEFFYSRDITERTREWYAEKLTAFVTWCKEQDVSDVKDLSKPLVRRYLAYLKETPSARGKEMSSHTRHGYARAVRAFCSYLENDGLWDNGFKWKDLMPKRDTFVKEVFNQQEIDALLRAVKGEPDKILASRDRAILAVLLDTGIRANELCSLTLDRVYFSVSDAHIVVNGKGRKQRPVWLGKHSRLALHRYIREYRPPSDCQEVFLTRRNTPLHPEGLTELLLRIQARTGLQTHVNPHKFRHTFAYLYMVNGGDVMRLSRLLGHGSVVITEEYVKQFGAEHAKPGTSLLDSLTRRD